jgi:hypothetical protein
LEKWRKDYYQIQNFDVLYASVLSLIVKDEVTKDDREKEILLRRVIALTEPTLKRQPGKRQAWLSYRAACRELGSMKLLRLEFAESVFTLDKIIGSIRRILKVHPDTEQYLLELSGSLQTKAVAYAAQQDYIGFQRVVEEAVEVERSRLAVDDDSIDAGQLQEKCLEKIASEIQQRLDDANSDEARRCFGDALNWVRSEQARRISSAAEAVPG